MTLFDQLSTLLSFALRHPFLALVSLTFLLIASLALFLAYRIFVSPRRLAVWNVPGPTHLESILFGSMIRQINEFVPVRRRAKRKRRAHPSSFSLQDVRGSRERELPHRVRLNSEVLYYPGRNEDHLERSRLRQPVSLLPSLIISSPSSVFQTPDDCSLFFSVIKNSYSYPKNILTTSYLSLLLSSDYGLIVSEGLTPLPLRFSFPSLRH